MQMRAKRCKRLDPYSLRARALDQPPSTFRFGPRALSPQPEARGSDPTADRAVRRAETNELSSAIEGLRHSIEESGARTLGEFLAGRHAQRETVRARRVVGALPGRAMYQEEFDLIRRRQKEHHNLSSEQWEQLQEIIFHQRPLLPVEPGWCQFEYGSGQKRAARALPIFQEFRILQEINNLRVQISAEPERPLSELERERVLQRLRTGKDISFSSPRDGFATGFLERRASPSTWRTAGAGRLGGDDTAKRLGRKELFGSRWHRLSLDERNAIVTFLLETEEPEIVRHKAIEAWGLTEPQAKSRCRRLAANRLRQFECEGHPQDPAPPGARESVRGCRKGGRLRAPCGISAAALRLTACLITAKFCSAMRSAQIQQRIRSREGEEAPLWTVCQSHGSYRLKSGAPCCQPPDRCPTASLRR